MMKNRLRKKYQKQFTKKLQELNNSCFNDELWRGRFVFTQKASDFYFFEDRSGGILTVFVRAYDKESGYYKDYRIEYAPYIHTINWHLSMDIANNFIMEAVEVWKESPHPYENTKDWRSIKVSIAEINKPDWNFFIDRAYWEEV